MASPADTAGAGEAVAGGSSSAMVAVAELLAMTAPGDAPTGADNRTENVSFCSSSRSPMTLTVTVLVVWPGSKVRIPLAASKSVPDVAVPLAVVQVTIAGSGEGLDSVTVKVTGVVVPGSPSVTEA